MPSADFWSGTHRSSTLKKKQGCLHATVLQPDSQICVILYIFSESPGHPMQSYLGLKEGIHRNSWADNTTNNNLATQKW